MYGGPPSLSNHIPERINDGTGPTQTSLHGGGKNSPISSGCELNSGQRKGLYKGGALFELTGRGPTWRKGNRIPFPVHWKSG